MFVTLVSQIRLHNDTQLDVSWELFRDGLLGVQQGTGLECLILHDVGGNRADVYVRCPEANEHTLTDFVKQVMLS